jgi:hypothetical protein
VVDRRKFIGALAASVFVSPAWGRDDAPAKRDGDNIVPSAASGAPNYWCTWAAQNYVYGHGLPSLDPKILEGDSGSRLAHDALTEKTIFGEDGWAKTFYPKIRSDLFFLFDDGWQSGGTATFQLDTAKFPTFAGPSEERLAKLNRAIEDAGWRGAALWCRNTPEGDAGHGIEDMSHSAGIRYWKIDIGDPAFDLIKVRDATHIPLTLEHVHGESPVNGDWRQSGRFGPQPWNSKRIEILRYTDVYRTYDVTSILSLPTTLDRVAEMLKGAEGHPEVHSLVNVEDEAYVAATLGCTMGIMRHPLSGMRPGADADLFFNGSREPKKRMDEVVRALRWQRIAPPFSPGQGYVMVDSEILTDSWLFARGQTWQNDLVGATVRQGAPARIARNIELPEVKTSGDKPFVFAARFPNGAVAIAAQERTRVGHAWYMPACDVALSVLDAPGPYGIFGLFNTLTLVFDKPLQARRILAQDLAGDVASDITSAVQIQGNRLSISEKVIRQAGLRNATPGDISAPGLVIAVS